MPNFIKYLIDIRVHFIIKNKILKNKVVSKTIRPIFFFFKSIIGLIQIFEESNSYFCNLNFENIKINKYIYLYILRNFSKFWEGHGPPSKYMHGSTPGYQGFDH